MNKTIKLPFNTERANEDMVKKFIEAGIFYVDENGIHVTESLNQKKMLIS